jgi:hypothetical protein
MKRICVIGNSHIAAIKEGWEIIKGDFPHLDITFFGAPSGKMNGLGVFNGVLRPKHGREELREFLTVTSQGKSQIEGDYDAYLACGLGYSGSWIATLFKYYRTDPEPRDKRQPISAECFEHAVDGYFRKKLCMQTVQKLRRITSQPIGIIPTPFQSDHAEHPKVQFLRNGASVQRVADGFHAVSMKIAQEYRVRFFFQPEETLASPLQTKEIYSRGSVRLSTNEKHEEDEDSHMNGQYGAITLRRVLDALSRYRPMQTTRMAQFGSPPARDMKKKKVS